MSGGVSELRGAGSSY